MNALALGSPLPTLEKPPVTREQLKLYAEASGDTNPIHLDEEAARAAGLPSAIAHGMITMAFFGECLHGAIASVKGAQLVEFICRFKAMTLIGDAITITGSVKTVDEQGIHCGLEARNQRGELTATGQALIRKCK